jgi:light-regulated signal transduction histidine kinase (bacteriophytochrome)
MRKDGSRLNVSLTISPVRDAAGRIVGASKIARDITERLRQEEALKAANAALEQANADLKQFTYSVSHDLQEPLRSVMIYSELLQKTCGEKLGDLGKEFIEHTVQGAERLHNLLNNLRIYTQISTSDESLGETEAAEALRKTLLNLEVAIKESGALISSTHLPRIRMNEFQLEQVFQNLIGNAIRYRSDLPPRVEIAAVRQDGQWLFTVRDNGIGIEPEFTEQIFGMFKRLHTAAKYPGSGMGLAICKRIIERAGGRIWVDSAPGSGSTFCFTVPGGTLAQESGREH